MIQPLKYKSEIFFWKFSFPLICNTSRQIEVQAGPEDQKDCLWVYPKDARVFTLLKVKILPRETRTQTKPRARDVRKRVTRAPEEAGRIVTIMPSQPSAGSLCEEKIHPYKMHFWRATSQFKRLNCERVGPQCMRTCDTFKTRARYRLGESHPRSALSLPWYHCTTLCDTFLFSLRAPQIHLYLLGDTK
jgi:hypothetical protein